MRNPFIERASRKEKQPRSYWRSKKQEKYLGKRFNAYRISGSGNGHKKGDLFIKGILRLEAKTTQRQSFSLTREMVDKVIHAGMACDEIPAIVLEFLDDNGKPVSEVAVVPVNMLEALIHAANTSKA